MLMKDRIYIKRFIQYYKPHRKMFFLDMGASLVLAVCDLFYPMLTREVLNVYVPNRMINMVVVTAAFLLCIYLVKLGMNYFTQYYGHVIGVKMQARMRQEIFDRLQRIPLKYFDDNKTGAIMSRITNDLFAVSELAHHGPEDLFISAVLLVGAFILMASVNLTMTLIIFCQIPIMIIFTLKKRLKLSAAFTKNHEELAVINAQLENSISGIRVSKAFTNKSYENDQFEAGNSAFVKARSAAYKVMGEFGAGNAFIADFLYISVLLTGGIFTYLGKINLGDYTAFVLYVGVFLNPIRRIVGFIEQLQEGMSGFRRFCEIMDLPVEEDSPDAVELKDVKGEIVFNDVSFSYGDGKAQVLSGISFDIPEGETVALVGPSGGGKTTICNLIPRFYEINSGSITIDGMDIRDVTSESLRDSIGIVAQDIFLFDGTVFDNIAYGSPGASREDVEKAAKFANIHDYVMTLPEGYDQLVGERGVKLSGGQKQRISIARVFLKDPPVLILDEATSSLDNATEMLIQQSLDELCRGRTTIIVAHRLSTIKHASKIIVIDDDGIREQGTHARLMDLNGIYAELYKYQFRDTE